jgi:hypothetical protein
MLLERWPYVVSMDVSKNWITEQSPMATGRLAYLIVTRQINPKPTKKITDWPADAVALGLRRSAFCR